MSDAALVEGIKLIGGIAGLGTAAFTFWDRAIRSRPTVNLSAPMPVGLGVPAKTLIKVRNPGAIDIIIEDIEASDEAVHVSSDETITSLLEAQLGVRGIATVPTGGERSFLLMDTRDDHAHGGDLTLTIRWRPVTAYFFSRPPVVVRLKAGILKELEKEAERRLRAAYDEGR